MAKAALGRGLGELLGEVEIAYETGDETVKSDIVELDVDIIQVNPYQPRKIFNEEKLQELSDSIVANGLLQPIVVTKSNDKFILIAGERRLRAVKLANISTIKAVILEVEDKKLRELALIENIQRDDLNIIEIAYSYAGLIQDYNITHEELSKIVSKSRSSITNILRVLTLSAFAQKMLASDKITLGHAKLIMGLDEEQQKLIIDSIVGQKLSVRETEALVKKLKEPEVKNTKKQTSKFDFTILDSVKQKLIDSKLKVQIDDKYFKIKITSQDDIEKIAEYFQNK